MEADELPANQAVVLLEELAPGTVSELDRLHGRADDVREEDGREDPVRFGFLPAACRADLVEELPDLLADAIGAGSAEGQVPESLELDETGGRDLPREVTRDLDRDDGVLHTVQDQCRHANARQDMPDVDLLVHPVERLQRAGAGAKAQHLQEQLRLLVREETERADRSQRALVRTEDV